MSLSNKEALNLAACKCSMCLHLAVGVQHMQGRATGPRQPVAPALRRVTLRGPGDAAGVSTPLCRAIRLGQQFCLPRR